MKYPTFTDDTRVEHGTRACGNCGGSTFKARRSIASRGWAAAAGIVGGWAGWAVLAAPWLAIVALPVWLLSPKAFVQCETCGLIYRRR